MTEALVPTKEHPAPLDAFESAKPDEPIWTVQGGDPLGAPLLRMWAFFARMRAGLPCTATVDEVVGEMREAVKKHSVAHDEREVDDLKVRATATEEISWSMDAYRRGQLRADVPSEATTSHVDALDRIDQHDLRVRIAQRLSNFRCEIIEMHQALDALGFDDQDALLDMTEAATNLQRLNEAIEPRRTMKEK